jgi:N-methylhydantoinase B
MAAGLDAQVLAHRLMSVAEGMGASLRRAAFSANIKERLDFSCAVFDAEARLAAQAAHIPVHLGAMPAAAAAILAAAGGRWAPGDVWVANDPYSGGSHLPDLTTLSPVFAADGTGPVLYLATRAHHADVGGMSPGSLPLAADLYGEGLILPPSPLALAGEPIAWFVDLIAANSRSPAERRGDLRAQLSAHAYGDTLLASWLPDAAAGARMLRGIDRLLERAASQTRAVLRTIPEGIYAAEDFLEDDGVGGGPHRLACTVRSVGGRLRVDFRGTDPALPTGLNAPLAVTHSAVVYVVACLVAAALDDEQALLNAGTFRPVDVRVPEGCLLNPTPGMAVAAGNVETSQRVVDLLLAALEPALAHLIPAASQGTMIGFASADLPPGAGRGRTHYETMAGGGGAGPRGPGADAIQVHMTNTRNTPVEVLEQELPLRVLRLALRRGSGGPGRHVGGRGLVKELAFLAPATVTLLTERRLLAPSGRQGGGAGRPGVNRLVHVDGEAQTLPAKITLRVAPGDRLTVETPGGGGWGREAGS